MSQLPPAGWFPDPERAGQLRYWDGTAWSEHRQPAAHPGTGMPGSGEPGTVVPYYSSTQHGYPTQVAPKNPALALLVSFFLPGVGSMINGDVGKGIGILVGYVISFFLIIVLIGIVGVIGFWIWGMVDAYQGARQWNARHGIIS
jgi:TM2 domain-containing membrane protein YozV